jgi:hypothetical protein
MKILRHMNPRDVLLRFCISMLAPAIIVLQLLAYTGVSNPKILTTIESGQIHNCIGDSCDCDGDAGPGLVEHYSSDSVRELGLVCTVSTTSTLPINMPEVFHPPSLG